MYALPKLGKLLTVEDFRPHVGETFLVQAEPEPVAIQLDDLRVSPGSPEMPREPFLLSFSTPWNTFLVEGHYPMRTPRGTTVQMHLIPTQTFHGPRRHYHAVFN